MVPICYEEALPNGCAANCAEFMTAATEQFMKEVIGSVLSRTRSNIVAGGVAGSIIMTNKYKRQLNRETAAFEEGRLHRAPLSNMLPVEAKEALSRKNIGIGDFRVALQMHSCTLGQMPDIMQGIMGGYQEGILEGWGRPVFEDEGDAGLVLNHSVPNGNLTNGTHINAIASRDQVDTAGWHGSGEEERKQLFSVLDECLTIGRS